MQKGDADRLTDDASMTNRGADEEEEQGQAGIRRRERRKTSKRTRTGMEGEDRREIRTEAFGLNTAEILVGNEDEVGALLDLVVGVVGVTRLSTGKEHPTAVDLVEVDRFVNEIAGIEDTGSLLERAIKDGGEGKNEGEGEDRRGEDEENKKAKNEPGWSRKGQSS